MNQTDPGDAGGAKDTVVGNFFCFFCFLSGPLALNTVMENN